MIVIHKLDKTMGLLRVDIQTVARCVCDKIDNDTFFNTRSLHVYRDGFIMSHSLKDGVIAVIEFKFVYSYVNEHCDGAEFKVTYNLINDIHIERLAHTWFHYYIGREIPQGQIHTLFRRLGIIEYMRVKEDEYKHQ